MENDKSLHNYFNSGWNATKTKIAVFIFRLVVFRKSNKAVIRLTVTPKEDVSLGNELIAGFTMQHLYTNSISSQKFDHCLNVFLTLGPLVGSE